MKIQKHTRKCDVRAEIIYKERDTTRRLGRSPENFDVVEDSCWESRFVSAP
jgi:hypothetical protein